MQIIVENLGKRYNRDWIFRHLTKTFQPGQTYAIVGANGSGKSTLLHTLWGQLPPTEGKIRYVSTRGSEVDHQEIFQQLAIATPYMELIEEFTIEEMVAFHFRFKSSSLNMPPGETIGRMGLSHAKGKRIHQFSSGMKQRLKLGLAFFSQAELLFLDEPTTNLDQNSVAWYTEELRIASQQKVVFIASNQHHEYPVTAEKIDLSSYKVTNRGGSRFISKP